MDLPDWFHFHADPASFSDLEEIHQMAFEFFDGDVSTLESMTALHQHNDKIFWIVRGNRKRAQKKIDGYFCVLPLKEAPAKLVMTEVLRGAKITNEHLAAGDDKPYALYVGAIAAQSLFSRAAALNYLVGFLDACRRQEIVNVYARPVTNDGLRVCRHHGFEIVDKQADAPLGKIHHLDLDREYRRRSNSAYIGGARRGKAN